ncbi:MAG: translocation/assembly module TamB [Bryobacterales bacterium]|nr:translocation/assembly module TamB [Bryobacterales bacterium]
MRGKARSTAAILVRIAAAILVLALITVLAAFIVVQSGWFHEYVRARIIAELERSTGGRVELGRFSFRGATLTAQVAPLILHGKETAGEPPLLRIENTALQMRVISIVERKIDLAFLRLEKPQVRIVTYPDGSTNLPSPRDHQRNWAEQLLDLGVRRYELLDGQFQYDDRKAALNLQGEGLQLRMRYEAKIPAYQVEFDSSRVRLLPATLAPVETGVSARFAIERTRIAFSQIRLSSKQARADLTGELRDFERPKGSFTVKASAPVRDLVQLFSVPLEPVGSAAFDGRIEFALDEKVTYAARGRVNARGLAYSHDRLKIEGANGRADMQLGPAQIALTDVDATALGAHFVGSASLRNWSKFEATGTIDGLTIAETARLATDRQMPWNGILAGDVSAKATLGQNDANARVNFAIAPFGSNPIAGRINASFDQSTGALTLNSSYAATAATRLDVSGTLDKTIQVQFRSTDLNDVLPALALADPQASQRQIPLELTNGLATASGSVSGRLENPQFQGQVSVTNGIVDGHAFDRFTATVNATKTSVAASRFTLARRMTDVSGNATITARQGSFDDAAVSGQATVRNADIQELAREAGSTIEVSGTANVTVRVSGSVHTPQAAIALDVQKPGAFGEQLDRLRANVQVAPDWIEVSRGDAEDGPGHLRFSGNYRRSGPNWRTGDAQVQLTAQNLPATRVEALKKMAPRFDAQLNADLQGRMHVSNGAYSLASADGNASAQKITLDKQPLGEVSLTGSTAGTNVAVTATGKVRDIAFNSQGSWRLDGDEPGSANIQFTRATIESLHKLAMLAGTAPATDQSELPFQGFVEGHAILSLALLHPQDFRAEVTLDAVQLNPKADQTLKLGVQVQDVTVRNTQPVIVDVNSREARVRSAQFIARDTDIQATGAIPFAAGAGADLALRGSINLIVLQLLNPNLLATGNATVQASLRGSLSDPMLNGRMELKGASLYLSDFPTGVDNANGVVLFDRNRATIESLTAQAGGGTIAFTGFLGFGQELIYRLQADAKQVRVRYPEDLSDTFSAQLALNGTSNASTLSGTLTIDRTVINPRADLGQLLAAAVGPSPTSADNAYLRGLQFNVHIESSAGFQLETSLAQDVEANVDLRLRGTPARPILLGSIGVDQGDIQVFGSKYTVDRGEIRFLNPVKLEPTLDVQLETKARGIAVTVSFTGTMQRMNVSYSSDPPLQQSEIIALLAVGRDPNSLGALSSAQSSSSSSGFTVAGGGLLSQALSDQLSSRFQRFFGASKVKIDPTITGVDYLPQARLTLEQQVSKDITFTYITNLNRTQEQIVRLEWNFDKNWSAVAVRDANGLFGIDFQYKRRFR